MPDRTDSPGLWRIWPSLFARQMIYVLKTHMKKVITYGTYDLLHRGHVNLLKRAKAMGDYLVVGLSSDEFNAVKNKKSFYSYEERKLVLEAVRYVDEVIPEHTWEQKKQDIAEHEIDIFVMGDDWRANSIISRIYARWSICRAPRA